MEGVNILNRTRCNKWERRVVLGVVDDVRGTPQSLVMLSILLAHHLHFSILLLLPSFYSPLFFLSFLLLAISLKPSMPMGTSLQPIILLHFSSPHTHCHIPLISCYFLSFLASTWNPFCFCTIREQKNVLRSCFNLQYKSFIRKYKTFWGLQSHKKSLLWTLTRFPFATILELFSIDINLMRRENLEDTFDLFYFIFFNVKNLLSNLVLLVFFNLSKNSSFIYDIEPPFII